MGELPLFYAAADVAFVGGSLVQHGGHNLLEPLASGCPVLFGPNIAEVDSQAAFAVETGAGVPVADASELAGAVVELLGDPSGTRQRGRRAAEELAQRTGSAQRIVDLIEGVLGDRRQAAAGGSLGEGGEGGEGAAAVGSGFVTPDSDAEAPDGPRH